MLENASHSGTVLQLPGAEPVTGDELWTTACRVAAWLAASWPTGSTIGAVLAPDRAAITLLLGAWRAGATIASLPQQTRTTSAAIYRSQVQAALDAAGAVAFFGTRPVAERLGVLRAIPVFAFDAPPETAEPVPTLGAPALIQFSSGSTGRPKGVRLSGDALVANVGAILSVIDADEAPVSYSWLPLSHDMGLIGTFLTAWAAGAPAHFGGSTIVLDEPEAFTRSPGSWLRRCAELGAIHTAGPSFAVDLVARRFPQPVPDLRQLRNIIVGAEPVRADVLRRFSEAAAGSGLRPTALRPAYGLAETAVAATMTSASARWSTISVDRAALAEGRVVLAQRGRELVSNGGPLPGCELRIRAASSCVGEIEMRGPSLLTGYLGEPARTADAWFPTGDLGFEVDGELYVVGRNDDRLVVAGRNVYPSDVEQAAGSVDGIREPLVGAVDDGAGKFLVVAASRRTRLDAERAHEVAVAVRRAVGQEIGLTPTAVVFVSARSFPLTPSGKVQRKALAAGLANGTLDVTHDIRFGGPRRKAD